jgi:predicted nucleic acid-binding protein
MSDSIDFPVNPVVLCDANVFYSVVLTDVLLSLAVAGLFRPRWTAQIHHEWMRNLQINRPELEWSKIDRRRAFMDAAIEDCLVNDYETLIPSLQLPDADDRHVLAAAIQSQATLILTFNLRDFPAATLAAYQLTAIHPDEFLKTTTKRKPVAVVTAIEQMRERKTRPPLSQAELYQKIANQTLPQFIAHLKSLH